MKIKVKLINLKSERLAGPKPRAGYYLNFDGIDRRIIQKAEKLSYQKDVTFHHCAYKFASKFSTLPIYVNLSRQRYR